MLRYLDGLNGVARLLLAEALAFIDHMRPFVVKDNNVLLFDHNKRAEVKRYLFHLTLLQLISCYSFVSFPSVYFLYAVPLNYIATRAFASV